MRISDIFTKISKTKPVQRFFTWANSPSKDHFLNKNLPQLETILATGTYCYSTYKRKEIPKDQRDLLQVQNVFSGACGLVVAGGLNRWVYKQGEKIIKDIDPKNIESAKALRKISTGVRIAGPLICTSLCMRWILPCFGAKFSTELLQKIREHKEKAHEKKLDIKA